MNPKSYSVLLKDNNGVFIGYLDQKITSLSWQWDRVGGCGSCDITIQEQWDSSFSVNLAEDYEINIFVPTATGTAELWYSGYIDRVSPAVSGRQESIKISVLGYVNQLKRIIVKDAVYYGELGSVAKSIVDTYITGNTKITSTASDYDDSGFTADYLSFNESVYECLSKLADIAGKREWGVRADKSIFFKRRSDNISNWFYVKKDFSSFTPENDFNPIITGIYLEGASGYNAKFNITNRTNMREEIVSNSSILTQSVGQQFARSYLKDKGVLKRNFSAQLVEKNKRYESSIPIGAASIVKEDFTGENYNAATAIYDSGDKYDKGNRVLQIERIRYVLTDFGINAQISFGGIPANIADEMSKLEYLINNTRNA
jgi:hypothetical protein